MSCKDLEELKNKHAETNNTITEIKNTLEGINSRISEAEEQISEQEDKMEITSEEQNKVNRTEDSLTDLWDNIKCTRLSLATRGEDWASQGQPKGKAEIPVVTRESRGNSRKTTWFPPLGKMRPLPATASQGKSPVPP